MSDTSLLTERRRTELDPAGPTMPSAFEQMRELVRNGYLPDAGEASERAIRLRHPQAPDLLLHPDGRIEIPGHQEPKPSKAFAIEPERRRMSKRRTLAIILLAAIFWFFSAYFTAVILEGM